MSSLIQRFLAKELRERGPTRHAICPKRSNFSAHLRCVARSHLLG